MNLLGMKRKLLPYGMPLGGGGAMGGLGAMSSAAPSSGGGKSSGAGQGGYSAAPAFGGQMNHMVQPDTIRPMALPYQPTVSPGLNLTHDVKPNAGPSDFTQMGIMNSKSSGAGQGGYGAVPAFQGQITGGPGMGPPGFQQPTAQTQPSFEQSPYGAGPSSVNSTTTADMMGGNRGSGQGFGQIMQGLRGGKSSGLGQGGYGMAPGFGGQQFNPFQQQQQQQFNQPQQPTPESLYAANMGMQQPQQQFNQQRFSPFQQQFGGFQQQQPQGISGLQSLFNSMMGQQRMQQPMQQMPRFQSQALQFRPNMQNAQAALSRVKPSVQKQQQDAQAARIAELEAQLAGYNSGG